VLNEERDPHNHSISQSRAIPAEPENVPSTKRAAAVNGSQRLCFVKKATTGYAGGHKEFHLWIEKEKLP